MEITLCTKSDFDHPTNNVSVAFHQSIGMHPLGEPNEEGVPVVRNYSGPGIDRVVFKKRI
jgi:predicted GNAT superfamily acetyltransferase